jgi:hypothetical protein
VILTIDNLDGNGAIDYSSALCADAPLTIERVLNTPSRCTGALDVGSPANPGASSTLIVPVRRGRVVVSAASGTVLFTGYLATEPVPVYVGVGLAGPVYRVAFTAVSDEWLLDKQTLTLTADGFTVPAGSLLQTLTARTAAGLLTTSQVQNGKPIGVFTPEIAKPWSANAGCIAASTYAAYRVLNGALVMQPVGTVTHALNFDAGQGDGTLQVAALKTSTVKDLANDVTLSGAIEPTAYVSELFAGDGATTLFTLSDAPFRISTPTLLADSFNQPAFNTQTWNVTDPGSHLSLGGAGLVLSGGNGFDGQTTLAAIDQVEMGGSLVIQAGNVQLTSPSDGVLCGLYSGAVQRANCFAGYNLRQSGGATVLTPFVNGAEVGTTYTLLSGHTYTLRIRLHSPEMQRVLQAYYALVDGVITQFGGGLVSSPLSLVFDLQDLGNASNTPATVLYDGAITSSPAACTFAAVNSVELTGSVGFCSVTQTGSAWVVSTLPGGTKQTRLIGVAGEGVDCKVTDTGKVTFFAGRVPVAGETVTVFYRLRSRAIARLEDAASIAAEAAGGQPGTARWLGKVLRPLARSSADCESAAQAVLSFAPAAPPPLLAATQRSIHPPIYGPAIFSASPPTARPSTWSSARSPSPMATPCPNCSPTASPSPTTGPIRWASRSPRPSRRTPSCRPPRSLRRVRCLPTCSSCPWSAPPQPLCRSMLEPTRPPAAASRCACATGSSAPAPARTWCCAAPSAASPSPAPLRWSATTSASSTHRIRRSTRASPAPYSQICRLRNRRKGAAR